MARINLVLSLIFLFSCATNKKKEDLLDIKKREELFSNQRNIDNLLKMKDVLFATVKSKKTCTQNWLKTVESYKQSLLGLKTDKKRVRIWFKLGNCYNFVGDYKRSMYYYDLVLSQRINDTNILAKLNYNIGQIYELSGQLDIAFSYYKEAFKYDDPSSLSLFKLAMLEFQQAEFESSLIYLNKLSRRIPRSKTVKFLQGVNYFHQNKRSLIRNKVLNSLDEKSVEAILLSIALDIEEGDKKKLETDLENLEVETFFAESFKKHLLSLVGR